MSPAISFDIVVVAQKVKVHCNYLMAVMLNLHYLALSCTILHIRYTCSQQMSPVTVFDIAVMAQTVEVYFF